MVLRFPLIIMAAAAVPLLTPASPVQAATSCQPVATFADGKLPAREIFLSPNGSDAAGDGSLAKPFQTLERAARGARAGTAIRFLPGTYAASPSIGAFEPVPPPADLDGDQMPEDWEKIDGADEHDPNDALLDNDRWNAGSQPRPAPAGPSA